MTMRAVGKVLLGLVVAAGSAAACAAQSGWRGVLAALGGGQGGGGGTGSIVGQWHGGKTENDPIHGGYLNLDFKFNFMNDGTYEEVAYMGNRQVMVATGTYQVSAARKRDDPSVTNLLSFTPARCQFASEALAEVVKFFPIPNRQSVQEYVGISPLAGGGQMTLQDASHGGDSWGLKPVH